MMAFCITLAAGCSKTDSVEPPTETTSQVIAKVSNTNAEQIVFTGDDILWFNGRTKELRFRNNYSNKTMLDAITAHAIKFYINDEYLFASILCVSSLSSQVFNSLVFYYNMIENKFFLADGYPEASVLPDPQKAQEERDENKRKIANEWNKFVNRLKLEGKYQEL
jgi:hypothetical protein